jgi:hypothetical protein
MRSSKVDTRRLAMALFAVGWMGGAAIAAPTAAVFPFEILDTSGEAASPDRDSRLKMATSVLADALENAGLYAPVDLGPLHTDVDATSPRFRCGDCFLPVARKAGAAFAVVPVVHKVSTLITSMDIWIFDAATGAGVAHASGQIRGDTDEAYKHGVLFLVKNRLMGDVRPTGDPPPK